ncbi:MAG TPA: CBASS cGAMP-activated phospholipase [Nocardioidaceae bacterium]
MRKILSIDGGGIRGVMPAVVLAEIERRTRRPVADLFDLVAGTSTGGILALGLSRPGAGGSPRYSAEDLVGLYESQGAKIFRRDPWRRFIALENLLDEKYSATGIEEVLSEYFGDATMSQALTEVLVTSYDIEHRRPYLFKRHKAQTDPRRDWPMWRAARATSAAPTYFEPAKLTFNGGKDYLALVDGGVYANNPAMCGYVEARKLWPAEHDFVVVSLGTGELTRRIPHDQAKNWGLAKWAQPILGVVFDGVSDAVDYQLRDLCSDEATRVSQYHRFQVVLTEGNDDMDDASRTNIRVLKLLAENLVEQRAGDLEDLCKLLAS